MKNAFTKLEYDAAEHKHVRGSLMAEQAWNSIGVDTLLA